MPANLLQFYCYDFPEICGWELTSHGTFVYRYLDHYFTEDSTTTSPKTAGKPA